MHPNATHASSLGFTSMKMCDTLPIRTKVTNPLAKSSSTCFSRVNCVHHPKFCSEVYSEVRKYVYHTKLLCDRMKENSRNLVSWMSHWTLDSLYLCGRCWLQGQCNHITVILPRNGDTIASRSQCTKVKKSFIWEFERTIQLNTDNKKITFFSTWADKRCINIQLPSADPLLKNLLYAEEVRFFRKTTSLHSFDLYIYIYIYL